MIGKNINRRYWLIIYMQIRNNPSHSKQSNYTSFYSVFSCDFLILVDIVVKQIIILISILVYRLMNKQLKYQSSEETLTLNEDGLWKIIKTQGKFINNHSKLVPNTSKNNQQQGNQQTRVQNFLKKIHDTVNESLSICSDGISEIMQNMEYDELKSGEMPELDGFGDRESQDRVANHNYEKDVFIMKLQQQLRIKAQNNHRLVQQNHRLSSQNFRLRNKIEALNLKNQFILGDLEELSKELTKQSVLLEEKISMQYQHKITSIYREITESIQGCLSCCRVIPKYPIKPNEKNSNVLSFGRNNNAYEQRCGPIDRKQRYRNKSSDSFKRGLDSIKSELQQCMGRRQNSCRKKLLTRKNDRRVI